MNLTEGYKHDRARRRKVSKDSADRAEECDYSCQDELVEKGKADKETMVNVSVSIWYTKEFAELEEDVQGYIDTCFEFSNAALAQSLVPMRLKHHGTYLYKGKEIYNGDKSLDAFSHVADKTDCADKTAVKETLKSADATLLLQSRSNVGGIAYQDSFDCPFSMAAHESARYCSNKYCISQNDYLTQVQFNFQGWRHFPSRTCT